MRLLADKPAAVRRCQSDGSWCSEELLALVLVLGVLVVLLLLALLVLFILFMFLSMLAALAGCQDCHSLLNAADMRLFCMHKKLLHPWSERLIDACLEPLGSLRQQPQS